MSSQEHLKSILIIAGEASGDVHGAGLVRHLKRMRPGLQFFGIGGDRMASEGVDTVFHVREMSFLGFFEVLKHLPFVRRVFRKMKTLLKERSPELVLLIDYPGFNLRFAKEAKKRGIPVLYYISPQVWAWGKKRVKKMAQRVDRMLVIFPFEEDLYRREGIEVLFVGHPLKDVVRMDRSKNEFFSELNLDPNTPLVGLLPGSRVQEIRRLLPEMKKAVEILRKEIPSLQVVLGWAPTLSDQVYTPFLEDAGFFIPLRNRTYEIMAHSDAVLVASGTATLETALLGTPMVILYKMSPISYLIGRALVRVKHFGLVNIVAGRKIVPELLQKEATGERMAKEVLTLLGSDAKRQQVKRDLQEVYRKLGEPGATERAANSVVEFMERQARRAH